MTVNTKLSITFTVLVFMASLSLLIIFPVMIGDNWTAEIHSVEEKGKEFDNIDVVEATLRYELVFTWKESKATIVNRSGVWYEMIGGEPVEMSWQKASAIREAWERKYSKDAKRKEAEKERIKGLLRGDK